MGYVGFVVRGTRSRDRVEGQEIAAPPRPEIGAAGRPATCGNSVGLSS